MAGGAGAAPRGAALFRRKRFPIDRSRFSPHNSSLAGRPLGPRSVRFVSASIGLASLSAREFGRTGLGLPLPREEL